MRRLLFITGMLVVLGNFSARAQSWTLTGADYTRALKQVTDVMVNDVTSPVAASRYYAYINLAAYEVQVQGENAGWSLAGRLNGFQYITASEVKKYDRALASIWMIYKIGARLLPSGFMLKPAEDSLLRLAGRRKTDSLLLHETRRQVDIIFNAVLDYSRADGFSKMNNLVRYTPVSGDGYWQPTGPTFMAPVEPHWNTLRPFLLNSARQFPVAAPAQYDTAGGSRFYAQMKEVYEVVNKADSQQQQVAMFWDCNPFAVQQIGHVEFGLKKISPGGHWIGIAGIACRKRGLDTRSTALVHAILSAGLADAFIACWDEKYRSNRIRPETAINRLMDPAWKPLLQTPPFPEYVSGHSVASTTAAHILTKIFGDGFSYADDTEMEFDLPVRHYQGFYAASREASVSRLYGGIHFRDAIDNGILMGEQIGKWTVERLKTAVAQTQKATREENRAGARGIQSGLH